MEIKYIPVNIVNGYPDRSPSVTQWDTGQFLYIKGCSLPAAFEVLFKNTKSDKLLLVAGVRENGKSTVQIPNSLLQEPYDITAYIVLRKGDSGKTVIEINLDMQKRLPPEEISSDPSDPHYINGLSELIQEVAAAAEDIEENAAIAAEAAKKAENATASVEEAIQAEKAAKAYANGAFLYSEDAIKAAEQATLSAAAAQATADTLTPADAHYNPESWIAQSGVAVSEAVWETLCNATDYTDEQLKNRVIIGSKPPSGQTAGDFEGQIYVDTVALVPYIYRGLDVASYQHKWLRPAEYSECVKFSDVAHSLNRSSESPISGKAIAELNAGFVPYSSQLQDGIDTVEDMLDFLDNTRIAQDLKISDLEAAINSNTNELEYSTVKKQDVCQSFDGESQNPQSGLAVTEAIAGAIGDIDAALDRIIALQNAYIGGDTE